MKRIAVEKRFLKFFVEVKKQKQKQEQNIINTFEVRRYDIHIFSVMKITNVQIYLSPYKFLSSRDVATGSIIELDFDLGERACSIYSIRTGFFSLGDFVVNFWTQSVDMETYLI